MDGLMIDSEPLHQEAFNKVFQKYGKELTTKDNNEFYVGLSDKDAAMDMVQRYSLPITAEELVRKKQKTYIEILASGIVPQPGLLPLLKKLKENKYKNVIASGCLLTEIKLVIDSLKINDYIQSYFSSEQVRRGKPSPDLFLHAANKMGINSSETLVLEDSSKGIDAANAAHMKSFAIPSSQTKGNNFKNATKVLNSLNDVFDSLKTL